MTHLSVAPWKRYGHDRLYVNRADGGKVAWFDRRSGELHVLDEAYRDEIVAALAPYMAADGPRRGGGPRATPRDAEPRATPRDSRPRATPPPIPEPRRTPGPASVPVSERPRPAVDAAAGDLAAGDLAANRPGEALRAKLDELTPTWIERLVALLLGKRSEAYGWRVGLAGERRVGARLERLAGRGWQVLHSIPLPRNVDIDHLLIGPGGVFAVNTKYHRGAEVWVGDQAVKIGPHSYPYVRKNRAEAVRASRALSRACGFAVEVRPVLAFVGARRVKVAASLGDVWVLQLEELSRFKRLPAVCSPAEVEALHAVAREPGTWAGG